MKEIKDIVNAYRRVVKEGRQAALATVVHLEGSAYRRPGARMLVADDGELTGAISGGCLEGDALRKAQLVMVQQKPMLVKYDTTDEEENLLGVGLGCNGILTILIEPITTNTSHNPIELLETYLKERCTVCMVTLFSTDKKMEQPGTCFLVKAPGEITGKNDIAGIDQLKQDALSALDNNTSHFKQYHPEHTYTAFFEILQPPVSLLIFGAGNDCKPLVEMAAVLGWETTVIDGRPNYATRHRFKQANKILVAKPNEVLDKVTIDHRTAILLMTHNYNFDMAILKQVIGLSQFYIGVLGPRKKMDRMLEELYEAGIKPASSDMQHVYGPAGLDLGSETPEEIALSILAEIKAVVAQRQGTFLRDKSISIHQREHVPPTELKA